MLKTKWVCSLCGWEGTADELEDNEKWKKVCPNCHKIGGLE